MIATIELATKTVKVDLSKPIDISMPITSDGKNPIAWYLDQPIIEPVKMGDWIGKVSEGSSSTNFNNIFFNPHAHGTHTECLGHITKEFYSINDALKSYFFEALVISVSPTQIGSDYVITKEILTKAVSVPFAEALIIRTLPNGVDKRSKNYSHTNPPFLDEEAATFIRTSGFKHLLIDLPSVDKEKDEGKLVAHKAFWNVTDVDKVNHDARFDCTITELIFVNDFIADGLYLLNLQLVSFDNDASPSKPILYSFI